MDLKPTNIIVSLASLLGIVLPGSIVAFLALTGAWRFALPRELVDVPTANPQGWVIFIVVAYIAGQVLYAFGSWFLDPVYDRTYRRYKEHVKGNPKRFVWPTIEAQFPSGPDSGYDSEPSNYSWARAYVVTRSPGSVSELDQLEADFKFFRSVTLVLVVAPFEALKIQPAYLLVGALVGLGLMACGALAKVFVDWRYYEYRRNPAHPMAWQLTACMIAIAVGLLLVVAVGSVLILNSGWGFIGTIGYWASIVVVLLRFCQQRWQRNETTYEYAAVLAAAANAAATVDQSSGNDHAVAADTRVPQAKDRKRADK
jgi:hypothetical protein